MHAAEKTQENLPDWNLNSLYSSNEDPKIKADLAEIKKQCIEFEKQYKGKIVESNAKALFTAISEYDAISDHIVRLASYGFLQYCTKMEDSEAQGLYQNIDEQLTDITKHLIFFTLEINNIEDSAMKALFTDAELATYESFIMDSRAYKPYQLTHIEEEIIHEKSLTARSAWVKFYEDYSAAMRFKFEGKDLTITEITNKLTSGDGKVRKAAADVIGGELEKNKKNISYIYSTIIKDKELEDNRRGFERPIQSQNLSNLVEDEVVDSLMETVADNYEALAQRYYKLKAKMLGVDVLNYWDRNAPLAADDTYIPWDKSKEIILAAYGEFDPQAAEIAKMFYDNSWIHAKPIAGKMSGAFSHGTCPSANPFIMVNYKGKTRDVMTVAHELGHGIHQHLAKKMGALKSRTPLTIAETASVFGEMLTFRKLLSLETDEAKKKLVIASKVEDMLNTVVRQIAMCNFELKAHDLRKQGEISPEKFGEIWYETQANSFGDSIKLDDKYRNYWTYVSHFFHTPFYVYSYAFGDCLVNSLFRVYEAKSVENFEDKYLEMLSLGGSRRYNELLKPFGLNAKDPKFWQQGLSLIADLIDEIS